MRNYGIFADKGALDISVYNLGDIFQDIGQTKECQHHHNQYLQK